MLELSSEPCGFAPGTKALWPGDGTADDLLGANSGRLGGSAGFAPGRVGQAFLFNGKKGYVEVPPESFDVPAGFSISAWVKFKQLGPADGSEMSLVEMTSMGRKGEGWWLAKTADNRLMFCVGNSNLTCASGSAVASSNTRVIADVWYQVTGSRGIGAVSLFINGIREATASAPAPAPEYDAPLRFGASYDGARILDGLMDEISFNTPALPDAAIRVMYEAGMRGECLHASDFK